MSEEQKDGANAPAEGGEAANAEGDAEANAEEGKEEEGQGERDQEYTVLGKSRPNTKTKFTMYSKYSQIDASSLVKVTEILLHISYSSFCFLKHLLKKRRKRNTRLMTN